jgi:deoxyribodipyrimidine photo-lyase
MSPAGTPAIWWVRRDLRLGDNPALLAAVASGAAVLPLFVLDPVLLKSAGSVRTAWLMASLAQLDADLRDLGSAGLSVVSGRPSTQVLEVAQQVGAGSVHISADFAPYGRRRDEGVRAALAEASVELRATGSPYAVAPGRLLNQSGRPFQVFTPYWRAWSEHGYHGPADALDPAGVTWLAAPDRTELPTINPEVAGLVGETRALKAWHAWLNRERDGVDDYAKQNNFPAPDATSHLSVALRWGYLHPRTLLTDAREHQSKGAAAFSRQIVWRDFYADVLYHRPDAVTQPIRPGFKEMPADDPETDRAAADRLRAWQQGRTGFPLVDAGMRQLLAENWMHNRVRMVVASFLVKDLHIGWWHGADWFMQQLRDGDIAQNQLNWQWVAGCGNDAAPYYRVFNPTTQSEKFDADGAYIRRYVPELAHVEKRYVHEPWASPDALPEGYPAPIVDHAAERKVALANYELVRSA